MSAQASARGAYRLGTPASAAATTPTPLHHTCGALSQHTPSSPVLALWRHTARLARVAPTLSRWQRPAPHRLPQPQRLLNTPQRLLNTPQRCCTGGCRPLARLAGAVLALHRRCAGGCQLAGRWPAGLLARPAAPVAAGCAQQGVRWPPGRGVWCKIDRPRCAVFAAPPKCRAGPPSPHGSPWPLCPHPFTHHPHHQRFT